MMQFLTLEMIKAHCKIEEDYEDALLEEYGESAEELVLNLMNRSLESLYEEYGKVPMNVKLACYLIVNNSVKYREPMSMQNLYKIDYSVDALLKSYMIL